MGLKLPTPSSVLRESLVDTKSGGSKNRSSPGCFQCTTLRECKILVLVGMCGPVLQIMTLFQTPKKPLTPFSTFSDLDPFSDLSLRNDVIIFYIRTETEIFLTIHFELAYFSLFFFSHSFGIETINTFVHSRSYLQIHTRFQTCTRK